jgi:hypothetical protein
MDSKESSGIPRILNRLLTVSIEGLVQAAVVAAVVLVLGIIWAWKRHLDAVWFNRVVGALATAFSIALILVLIVVLREVVAWIRDHRRVLVPEKGFLDHRLDAERAILALPASMAKLTAIMKEVGSAMEKHTNSLQAAGSTAQQIKVSEAASRSLDKYSARVDRVAVKYARIGGSLSLGLSGWSKWIENTRPSKVSFADFPQSLSEFIPVMDRSNDNMRTYIATVRNMRGVSSALNAAVDRHINSLVAIFNTNVSIHTACCETLKIIESLA